MPASNPFSLRVFSPLVFALAIGLGLSVPADAAQPLFDGEWSVKWCDNADLRTECGGFHVSLVQRGEHICGTYDGARVRLTQVDEGGERAIRGAAVGRIAILTLRSARSGDLHLVRAEVRGKTMRWRVLETLEDVEGDIDILALDDTLQKAPGGKPVSESRTETERTCAAIVRGR
jgi:hypothetical protein